MKKSTLLKQMLRSSELEFLMEAHNGLSAKIVEEAGFKGIWASGLSISAALGVRDSNEASWTQVLEVLEFMSDATSIPILLDGDTGYGNFNNMRRLVKKLEQRNVAGVCIEDKLFPKTNSFINGEAQPLADMDEFCGKIKAAKECQTDPDFVVVARVEALIAGWGLQEALKRAEAYRKAGADAILIHSKKSSPSEIQAFMKEWGNRHPVVIVPTKYYSTPTDVFREIGVSTVIWANHNVRSCISAMQATTKRIFEEQTLINVEDKVATVDEIFRLQGEDELRKAEKKYLPVSGKNVNAIVLAASQGERLGVLTKALPKALLKIGNKTVLENLTEKLNRTGIKDIAVVRGFGKEHFKMPNLKMIDNDEHAASKELYSLYLARNELRENTVISYGDITFKSFILLELLNDESDVTLIVDADLQKSDEYCDYVKAELPYSRKLYGSSVQLKEISPRIPANEADGEFIGLWKVGPKGAKRARELLEELASTSGFKQMRMAEFLNELSKSISVSVKYIKGSWLDIDDVVDLQKANEGDA